MNATEREALAQAKAIHGRADYTSLSAEVRQWVESILNRYGSK